MKKLDLGAIPTIRKTGAEPFLLAGRSIGADLLGFWQWSSSELVGNALRGVLAEYIVATAVGANGGVRTQWDAYDVETADGIKVEVKSAAFLQSWWQAKLSSIQFSVRPAYGWDAETNSRSASRNRPADVYVFCVLAHKDKRTANPLNLDQWVFYCINTAAIDQKLAAQKTLSLSRLRRLGPVEVRYAGLAQAIRQVAHGRN